MTCSVIACFVPGIRPMCSSERKRATSHKVREVFAHLIFALGMRLLLWKGDEAERTNRKCTCVCSIERVQKFSICVYSLTYSVVSWYLDKDTD